MLVDRVIDDDRTVGQRTVRPMPPKKASVLRVEFVDRSIRARDDHIAAVQHRVAQHRAARSPIPYECLVIGKKRKHLPALRGDNQSITAVEDRGGRDRAAGADRPPLDRFARPGGMPDKGINVTIGAAHEQRVSGADRRTTHGKVATKTRNSLARIAVQNVRPVRRHESREAVTRRGRDMPRL